MGKPKQSNSDLPIPFGWRTLKVGECRRVGDKFYQNGRWQLSCLAGYEITELDPIVIRDISTEIGSPKHSKKKEPETRRDFFNPISLVPTSLLRGAMAAFHAETTSEKVQKYLKRINQQNEGKKNPA